MEAAEAVLGAVEIRIPPEHVEAIGRELESMATDLKDEISDIRELIDKDQPVPEGWSILPLEFRVESLKEVTRRFGDGEVPVLSGGPQDRGAMAEVLYGAILNPACKLHGHAEARQTPYAEVKAEIDRLAWLRDCLEQLGGPDRGSDLHD